MPVKKPMMQEPMSNMEPKKPASSCSSSCSSLHLMCNPLVGRIMLTLIALVMVYGIVFLGTVIRNNIQEYKFIGKADTQERFITLDAKGIVTSKPDVAMISMGTSATAATVADAQKLNTEKLNALYAKVAELGIEKEDVKTKQYSAFPNYQYTEAEGQTITGYTVDQQAEIKIRNLDNAGKVLALAGELGLNQIGGLQLMVDNEEVYIEQARKDALEKIAKKADMLEKELGVTFKKVYSYNEYRDNMYGPYPIYESFDYAVKSSPTIEPGETDITLNVSVTFDIQ